MGIDNDLLKNNDFEDHLGSEWQLRTSSGITIIRDASVKFSGEYSLKLEDTVLVYTDYYGCNQTILIPNTSKWMTLQASIKKNNLAGIAGIDIHFLNSAGQRLPIYDAKILLDSKSTDIDWKKYSIDFYVPDNTKKITIALFIKGQGSIWFDKLSLRYSETVNATAMQPSNGAYILKNGNPMIWYEYAEQKVYHITPPPKEIRDTGIYIKGARNELESFQLVVKPQSTLKNCTIEFTDLLHTKNRNIIEKNQLTYFVVGYVDVKNKSTTQGVRGPNPDYLLKKYRFNLLAEANNPIWINIKIPEKILPGIYKGDILFKIGNIIHARIPLQVTVWDFTIPLNSHIYVRSNFWLSLINKYNHRGNETILADYYQNLQDHRVNTFSQIDLKTTIIGDRVVCFFDEFDRKISNLFEDYGFRATTVGPFIGDAAGWKYRQTWMGVDPASAEFEPLLKQYCSELEVFLSAKGWIDRCWISYWDEPQLDDPNFKEIVRIGRIIKEAAPNLKIFMTTWPIRELFDIVDIWCLPFTKAYFHDQDIIKRKMLGEKIFVYHNDPYIDTPLIDKRLYAWRYQLAGVDGVYAWWNLTFWQKNPYEFSSQVEQKGNKENILKSGDGVLLYPNPDSSGPPVNSLRWEIFYQGLEDYEYFWLLKKAIQRSMKKLNMNSEFSDYADYRINQYLNMMLNDYFDVRNRDVQYLYEIRTQIAEELLTIEQSPIAFIKTQLLEGTLEHNQIVKITGLTEQTTKVLINNKSVSANDDGTFTTYIKSPSDGIIIIKCSHGLQKKVIKRKI